MNNQPSCLFWTITLLCSSLLIHFLNGILLQLQSQMGKQCHLCPVSPLIRPNKMIIMNRSGSAQVSSQKNIRHFRDTNGISSHYKPAPKPIRINDINSSIASRCSGRVDPCHSLSRIPSNAKTICEVSTLLRYCTTPVLSFIPLVSLLYYSPLVDETVEKCPLIPVDCPI